MHYIKQNTMSKRKKNYTSFYFEKTQKAFVFNFIENVEVQLQTS
jgi:hypothetical protein